MIWIWGSGMYGKCDEVPGVCHVATQFGHLWYIPLIPTGTYAIIEKHDDGSFNGAKIPFSFKSLLLAWFRVAAILGLISGVCITYVGFDVNDGWIPLGITLSILGALIGSYKLFGTASYERAKVVGEHLGLNKTGMMLIEVAYGRESADRLEADAGGADDASADERYGDHQACEVAQDEDDEKNPYRNF
ncbi:MAG: hypothetical protein O2820_01485 [Planctomycetota bacterium]|nr:hypothetical protein [Planctomycetota bacterium]MDA1247870.1 hypothetical protein [Planctomycetota bacterium]